MHQAAVVTFVIDASKSSVSCFPYSDDTYYHPGCTILFLKGIFVNATKTLQLDVECIKKDIGQSSSSGEHYMLSISEVQLVHSMTGTMRRVDVEDYFSVQNVDDEIQAIMEEELVRHAADVYDDDYADGVDDDDDYADDDYADEVDLHDDPYDRDVPNRFLDRSHLPDLGEFAQRPYDDDSMDLYLYDEPFNLFDLMYDIEEYYDDYILEAYRARAYKLKLIHSRHDDVGAYPDDDVVGEYPDGDVGAYYDDDVGENSDDDIFSIS